MVAPFDAGTRFRATPRPARTRAGRPQPPQPQTRAFGRSKKPIHARAARHSPATGPRRPPVDPTRRARSRPAIADGQEGQQEAGGGQARGCARPRQERGGQEGGEEGRQEEVIDAWRPRGAHAGNSACMRTETCNRAPLSPLRWAELDWVGRGGTRAPGPGACQACTQVSNANARPLAGAPLGFQLGSCSSTTCLLHARCFARLPSVIQGLHRGGALVPPLRAHHVHSGFANKPVVHGPPTGRKPI